MLHGFIIIDHFPAQVIAAFDQRVRTAPFVVTAQNEESARSTVIACSPAAGALDIHRGMPVQWVRKRYPSVAVMTRDLELEQTVISEAEGILEMYTPEHHVAQTGICWMNLSGTPTQRSNNQRVTLNDLKLRMRSCLSLGAIAVGVGKSRVIARIMAQLAMPDSIRVCAQEGMESLWELDSSMLPGISANAREKLRKYGLRTIGQVASLSKEDLHLRFGSEGERIYSIAHGVDSEFASSRPEEVLQAESTLDRDINDHHLLIQHVRYTVDKLCFQIKSRRMNLTRLLFVLRYADNKTVQKTLVFRNPTNDFLAISSAATRMFEELYTRRVGIKTIRLVAKRPCKETGQLDLFETVWQWKQTRLSEGITNIRTRMPFDAILTAAQQARVG
jgi:DNA polymerase-4